MFRTLYGPVHVHSFLSFFQYDRHLEFRFDANLEIHGSEQASLLDGVCAEIMLQRPQRAPSTKALIKQDGYIPTISKSKCEASGVR